jgi:nicotinamidase-related amidase
MHDWRIADREYARHRERRGRLNAFETIAPARTALIVIDMIPFFLDQNRHCRDIVPNINRIADALRHTGGTVAWVLPSPHEPYPELADEFYGPEIARLYRNSAPGDHLPAKLGHGLEHRPTDLFVEKSGPSAFFPGLCPLPATLRERGVDTVLIVGTVTNVCCESSARDARAQGFRVVMVADANAARTDAEHNATLHTIYRSFGDVRPTAEILALIAVRKTSPTSA